MRDEYHSSGRREAQTAPRAVPGARLRDLGRRIADVVVPPCCVACHARVWGHDTLCAACWRRVTFIRAPVCDRLGLPLPFGSAADGPLISAAAAAAPPRYDRARAAVVFNEESVGRDLIHGLKYADRHDARRLLGRWLTSAGADLFPGADLLVPVPMTRWRLLRRQFNQSALLAHEVGAATGIPVASQALAKNKTTPPQVGLTRLQRAENVRGAFRVPPGHVQAIAGRNVIVVDDVITTGATVEACAMALKAAGAARVDILAIALVTRPLQATV